MAGTATGGRRAPRYSIKTIWGLAKCPELHLGKDELYTIVQRETGKESIKALTQAEINKVCNALSKLKDATATKEPKKRTDKGGNAVTENQRRKIFMLTGELGWNDNTARVNGFVKRMFKIDRLEWLTFSQCSKLIEALKKMVEREAEAKEARASGSSQEEA